ncbi:MAG: N-acetyltransferase family protein [Mangrovibacterium sp.]
MNYRNQLKKTDPAAFDRVLRSTAVFYDSEIKVALELADCCLKQGEASGYYFIVAEHNERVLGYICFGPTPCTRASWDVYWIAVAKACQGRKLGAELLQLAEKKITGMQGINIWIETSSRPEYFATRMFYQKQGYRNISELPDFYDYGDHKIVYGKHF